MIKMQCPHCSHGLRIPNEFSGKRGRCKYCKQVFIVDAEQFDTPYGEDVDTQRERKQKEDHVRTMQEAHRQLEEARAARAKIDRRDKRRLILSMIAALLIVGGGIVGAAVWLSAEEQDSVRSVFMDSDASGIAITYETHELQGVTIPYFYEAPKPLDVSIAWKAAFDDTEKDAVTCYEIPVVKDYDGVVSDFQVAIAELGWDFTIWMDNDPGPQTELHGEVNGKRVAIRIEDTPSGLYAYAGVME